MSRNYANSFSKNRRSLMASCLMSASLFATSAASAEESFMVNLQSQSAGQSLIELAEKAGSQIVLPKGLGSVQLPALKGQYTLAGALDALLGGTSLSYEITANNVIVVREKSTEADMAADDKSSSSSFVLEEIIVTATKRSTNLQDTAMALSVVSGDSLEKRGYTDMQSFIATVPGVSSPDNHSIFPSVKIRGVSTNNYGHVSNKTTATTSTYLDEFPLGLNAVSVRLVDISRVEVLKGPQGTLYGQSAMGGTIRYITNKPNTERVEGGVSSYFSRTDEGGSNHGIQGYLNVPLSDTLAVRGVFYKYDNDGFIDGVNTFITDDNLGNGRLVSRIENANTKNIMGGRFALRWQAAGNTTFDLVYLNETLKIGAFDVVSDTFTPALFGNPVTNFKAADFKTLESRYIFPNSAKYQVLNLKLDMEFDAFDLNLMAAHKDMTPTNRGDSAPFINLTLGGLPVLREFPRDIDTLELRLVSNHEEGEFLSWIAGAWFEDFNETRTEDFRMWTGSDDITVFGLSNGTYLGKTIEKANGRELAFYGEAGLHFTDDAVLTLGYRRANVRYKNNLIANRDIFPLSSTVDPGINQNVNTYKANFEYAVTDDILLYAQASSGYRRGGFVGGNFLGTVPASEFKSDSLWNYELGARTSWLDNRLIVNANIYRIDWSDLQLLNFPDPDTDPFFSRIDNVGRARIDGLELEVQLHVNEYLTLGANYGYIDAKIRDDIPAENVVAGDRLPGSAKHSYTVSADWISPVGDDLDLTVSLTHQYSGNIVETLGQGGGALVAAPPNPALALTDLRIGLEDSNGLSFSIFADNLFNNVKRRLFFTSPAQDFFYINNPRTVGVNVGYKF